VPHSHFEQRVAARLFLAAPSRALIHPNQYGSLPGLSTYDACLTLMNDMKALQRPRLKVSSLFVDIKAGFNNVDNPTLPRVLREGGIPHYLVSWVASFLAQQSCTLAFKGAPSTPTPVNIGVPQGTPISPFLFLIYLAPLHFSILRGLMGFYVDDLALTAASIGYRWKIRCLQVLFRTIQARATHLDLSFCVVKTELLHWRTRSQAHSQWCLSPIQLDTESFTPRTPSHG